MYGIRSLLWSFGDLRDPGITATSSTSRVAASKVPAALHPQLHQRPGCLRTPSAVKESASWACLQAGTSGGPFLAFMFLPSDPPAPCHHPGTFHIYSLSPLLPLGFLGLQKAPTPTPHLRLFPVLLNSTPGITHVCP